MTYDIPNKTIPPSAPKGRVTRQEAEHIALVFEHCISRANLGPEELGFALACANVVRRCLWHPEIAEEARHG